MRRGLVPASVLLAASLLSGCGREAFLPDGGWETGALYVGTYAEAEKSDGTKADYFLNLLFPTGEELSERGTDGEPELSYDLKSEGKDLSGTGDGVRYVDVAAAYRAEKGKDLEDLVASGGAVVAFTSVGRYEAGSEAASGRLVIAQLGYVYALSGFSVQGEELAYQRTKVVRRYAGGKEGKDD